MKRKIPEAFKPYIKKKGEKPSPKVDADARTKYMVDRAEALMRLPSYNKQNRTV